jgi:hypothetical protein
MPFEKDLAPGTLHAHEAHGQAVARIQWCICEQAIRVISGEWGAGKTVAARAAGAGLDASEGADGLRPMLGVLVARRPIAGEPVADHDRAGLGVPDSELPRRRPRDVWDHLQPTAPQGATVRFNSHFDHHLAGRSASPHASRRPAEERLISLHRLSNRSRPGQTTSQSVQRDRDAIRGRPPPPGGSPWGA